MVVTKRMEMAIGILLCAVSVGGILHEWRVEVEFIRWTTGILVLIAVPIMTLKAKGDRRVFVAIAVALTVLDALVQADWPQVMLSGLETAAFIAAFFVALSTLGDAARSAPSIKECGRFLAQQPPGRRYAALTVGGQLFSLLLGYGSIPLLGSLALANSGQTSDERVRSIRTRRMLLAIHRALMSTVPWSPLSLAITFTTVLIPGTSWGRAVLPCLVSGAILALTGWAIDTVFKPRPTGSARPATQPEGSWFSLVPLLALLCILAAAVGVLYELSHVRIPGLVMVAVPIVAASWIAWQERRRGPVRRLAARMKAFAGENLPAQSPEILLLMMAGYIGTVGAPLIAPLAVRLGLDLSFLPGAVILAALVWLMPLVGQIGMNPVLAAGLLVPILPSAAQMGVAPTAIVVALTAGWALSGICSPYTATTILIGGFAGITPRAVGLRWNGVYTLLTGILLSAWVVTYGVVLAGS